MIRELKVVWPRGDIKDMLVAWMADNNTNDWSVGIKFVQFLKNSSLHSGIQRSPFSALFGCDAKVGLTTSSLPEEILERMHSEEDLLTAFATSNAVPVENGSTETESATEVELTPGPSFLEPSIPTHDDSLQVFSSEETLIRCDDMPVFTPVRHVSASVTEYEPPIMSPIVTAADLLNARQNNILAERNAANSSQVNQAERMVKRSRLHLPPGQPGDTVAVPIPLVDRAEVIQETFLGSFSTVMTMTCTRFVSVQRS